MDGQFEKIQEKITQRRVRINISSRNEHAPEIEHYIHTLKERLRCVYNELPYKKIPARITAEMVFIAIFRLNSFPRKNGI